MPCARRSRAAELRSCSLSVLLYAVQAGLEDVLDAQRRVSSYWKRLRSILQPLKPILQLERAQRCL